MLDSSLMQLMWLASPALPIGGFSYSECLEAAVDTARAATESEASAWLVDHLHLSLARSELSDLTIYVIDVAAGEKISRKSLKPFVMTNLKTLDDLKEVISFIETKGLLRAS